MKTTKLFPILTAAFLALFASCVGLKPVDPESPEDVEVTGITLSEAKISVEVNEEKTLVAEVRPSNATDKTVVWSSDDASVASVTDGKVKGVSAGSATITAKAGKFSASCAVTVTKKEEEHPDDPDNPDPVINISSEKMVDLGLSVKWAGWNVGASRPEEFGDYFCWGETSPKSSYWQDGYKWGVINKYGTPDNITKYNVKAEYGTVDGRTRLTAADDAAYVNWGESWRMPTDEEKTELLANTVQTRDTLNGVPGWAFTSKKNNVSIFFPATGVKEQLNTSYVGEETIFWTATLRTNDPRFAHVACNWIEDSMLLHEAGFQMDPTAESYHLSKWRYFGLPVRAVSGGAIPEDKYNLVTSPAESVTPCSAVVGVSIDPPASTTEFGVLYALSGSVDLVPEKASKASAGTDGRVRLIGLTPSREYVACAYAVVDGATYTGNRISFITGDMIPLVALDPEEVTSGTARLKARIGDLSVFSSAGIDVECGIAYAKSENGYSSLTGESSHLSLTPDSEGLVAGTALALNSNTKYFYRAYLKAGDKFYFGENYKEFTTEYPALDKWVDLGLSVMWANWDIGAESGEDKTGYKFAWGEAESKTEFSISNYKWLDTGKKYTKYVTDEKYGTVDGKKVLEAADDAASAAWGMQGARIPTVEEFEELIEKCTVKLEYYMRNARVKFTGPNGNSIYMNDVDNYWTSTLNETNNAEAYSFYLYNKKDYIRKDSYPRHASRLVRAVKPVEIVVN